jgi:hypothetical protein
MFSGLGFVLQIRLGAVNVLTHNSALTALFFIYG